MIVEISLRSCGIPSCRFELRGLDHEKLNAAFQRAKAIAAEEEGQLQQALARGGKPKGWTWQAKETVGWEDVGANRPDTFRFIRRWMASDPIGMGPTDEPDLPVIGFIQYANDKSTLHVSPEHPLEVGLRGLTGEEVDDIVLRRSIDEFHRELLSCRGKLGDEATSSKA